MADEYRTVDVWVGTFGSEEQLKAYLEEASSDEDEDEPGLSPFSDDQGGEWVDHDFVESSFHEKAGELAGLLEGHSFASSYGPAACEAFRTAGIGKANAVVLVWGGEIEAPRSAKGADYSLTYVGRFASNPDAA